MASEDLPVPRSGSRVVVDGAALAYSENTLLRATVNAIPMIGGALDVLLATKGQTIVNSRIQKFLEILHDRLASVEQQAVRRDFMQSEDFFDTVVAALESAARIADEARQRDIAGILAGTAHGQWDPTLEPRQAIAMLRDLTPGQLAIAKEIFQTQREPPSEKQNDLQWATACGWNDLAKRLNLSPDQFLSACILLQRAGLLREVIGAFMDYRGGVFVITPAFRSLMAYLKAADGR